MGRIRKVNRWRGEETAGKCRTEMDSSNREWVDWLPWSLRSGPTRVGPPLGMAGCKWRVSERDTGVELMQEWKFGRRVRPAFARGFGGNGLASVLQLVRQ